LILGINYARCGDSIKVRIIKEIAILFDFNVFVSVAFIGLQQSE